MELPFFHMGPASPHWGEPFFYMNGANFYMGERSPREGKGSEPTGRRGKCEGETKNCEGRRPERPVARSFHILFGRFHMNGGLLEERRRGFHMESRPFYMRTRWPLMMRAASYPDLASTCFAGSSGCALRRRRPDVCGSGDCPVEDWGVSTERLCQGAGCLALGLGALSPP